MRARKNHPARSRTRQSSPVEIILIVDESASMEVRAAEVVRGVNDFLQEQRTSQDVNSFVSIYKFNSGFQTWFEARPAATCGVVTSEDYRPDGMTALYDAIGEAIERTEFRTECCDDDPKVVFMIVTDGHENSSRRFSGPRVRAEIDRVQSKGWQVLFLGVDHQSLRQAMDIGIREDRVIMYSVASESAHDSLRMLGEKAVLFCVTKSSSGLDFSDVDRAKLMRLSGAGPADR